MNRKLVFISACIFFVVGFSAENDEGRFDPSSLNKWTRELNEPFVVHNIEQSLKIKRIQDSLKVSGVAENSRRFIFQIQLVQTSDYASALTLESSAREVFQESLELVFDSPYYKIRVGKFDTREEAEKFQIEARQKGYPAAWIVRTEEWQTKK